jgi:uncharacterized protein
MSSRWRPTTSSVRSCSIATASGSVRRASSAPSSQAMTRADAVIAQAKAAGATVTDEPHDRAWGVYSGYFRDPDGHLWEIIWNPRAES